jgi:carboxyl-terminal processing protease
MDTIKGMLAGLDPYTVYLMNRKWWKFKINNREYTGIGALITRRGKIIIREVYKDFPADSWS